MYITPIATLVPASNPTVEPAQFSSRAKARVLLVSVPSQSVVLERHLLQLGLPGVAGVEPAVHEHVLGQALHGVPAALLLIVVAVLHGRGRDDVGAQQHRLRREEVVEEVLVQLDRLHHEVRRAVRLGHRRLEGESRERERVEEDGGELGQELYPRTKESLPKE